VFGFSLFSCLIALPCAWTTAQESYAKLLVYGDMRTEYVGLIDATAAKQIPASDNSDTVVEGLKNLQHSTNVANRMAELRDYDRWYRETLQLYRYYTKNWFFRDWIPKLPAELR